MPAMAKFIYKQYASQWNQIGKMQQCWNMLTNRIHKIILFIIMHRTQEEAQHNGTRSFSRRYFVFFLILIRQKQWAVNIVVINERKPINIYPVCVLVPSLSLARRNMWFTSIDAHHISQMQSANWFLISTINLFIHITVQRNYNWPNAIYCWYEITIFYNRNCGRNVDRNRCRQNKNYINENPSLLFNK